MSDSGDAEQPDASSSGRLTESDKSESKKKLIRLLTVMAYVSSVSSAAVMLSLYYIFLWEPKVPEHHLRADPNGPLALQQPEQPLPEGSGGYPRGYPEGYPRGGGSYSEGYHPDGYPRGYSGGLPPGYGTYDAQPRWPPAPPPQSLSLVSEQQLAGGRASSFLVQRIAATASSSIRAARTPPATSSTAAAAGLPGKAPKVTMTSSAAPQPTTTTATSTADSSVSPTEDLAAQWAAGAEVNSTWAPGETSEQPAAT